MSLSYEEKVRTIFALVVSVICIVACIINIFTILAF
jgi:hypothetical protein